MKRSIIKYFLSSVLVAASFACHKLDVPITTELTTDTYPQDSASFITAAGPVYVVLRGNFAVEWAMQNSLSTDETIFPARGGNWYDGGQNVQMHYHTWTRDNGYVNGNWTWLSTIIGVSNQTLDILGKTESEGDTKNRHLAEIKMVRALAYFWMMDNYGRVPLDTVAGDYTPHSNVDRTVTFSFIEREILNALPYLSRATGVSTYGRANKFMAFALLAKLYLNAEYYTGTQRYNDCITACDSIINSNMYTLAGIGNYLDMFKYNNGPATPEFIFAVPYDPNFNNGSWPFRGVSLNSRYDVPRSMGNVAPGAGYNYFNIPFVPGAPRSTIPSFYAYFYDANDVRNGQWLHGKQFKQDGTPITITTTYAGYDAITYAGNNAPYTYQLDITPDVILRQSTELFDCGNDEVAWNMGYRNIKFYPDPTSPNRNQNNDIPVFRYADILITKAEAILRGGSPTNGATALNLVNQIRAQRTTSPGWTNITLDSIYNERTREFAMEAWHRNDMIRFGKFENSWGFKTDNDVNHRIFPIPTNAIKLNPNLTQNPGY
ncbi:RagB/SusD family nutrient uptake outer membrane protein [Chitinophaga silvisoli]|uniref:RagB/SusD family nutrient uptake outer membrane protein n=1 Tax=Chitinophaga silvisoli TaxID=2291814 RepID=A0A3E1P3A7_9BACT|nr:RagB/SusD family nutrient uptake outer membrane protein [Chitinophaga silvisoli]RFM34478.1 RagB/SusD family nutrient uptake outer membrane protein [Chitinophaga silvisoli]